MLLLVAQTIKVYSSNEKLNKINIDLNAGAEMNKYLSMEGKVSLSRTKAEDRPYFGSYGVIAQLIGIPHNVSLDDLRKYSTESSAHVNWAGPNPGLENPYYVQDQRHNSDDVGELSDITMLKLTLQTGYTSALNMHSTTTAHVLKTQICRTVSVKLLQILLMTAWGRNEENFFESNAEFILAGDNPYR